METPPGSGNHTLRRSVVKKASWKTTTAGIVAALSILFHQANALLDEDPKTLFDVTQVTAAIGMLWMGISARDNNVTSEQAKAK
jgi:hypothetical protein